MHIQLIDTATSRDLQVFERSFPNDNALREVNIGEKDLYQRAYLQVLIQVSCQ
jgi:hypothetical protein